MEYSVANKHQLWQCQLIWQCQLNTQHLYLTLKRELTLFKNKCVSMHSVVSGHAPKKIVRSFAFNLKRHNHTLVFPRPRNNMFKTSFIFSGGTAWNNLPKPLKNIQSKHTFKNALKKHLLGKELLEC